MRLIGRDTFWIDSAFCATGKFVTKSASWLKSLTPSACAATDAVSTLPFRPNETPFELENVTADRLLLVVPAEKLTPPAITEAVMVLPAMPNETLFEIEKTIVPIETDEPRAEIAMGLLPTAVTTSAPVSSSKIQSRASDHCKQYPAGRTNCPPRPGVIVAVTPLIVRVTTIGLGADGSLLVIVSVFRFRTLLAAVGPGQMTCVVAAVNGVFCPSGRMGASGEPGPWSIQLAVTSMGATPDVVSETLSAAARRMIVTDAVYRTSRSDAPDTFTSVRSVCCSSQSTAVGADPEPGASAERAALSAAAVSCVYLPSAAICESALAVFHAVWKFLIDRVAYWGAPVRRIEPRRSSAIALSTSSSTLPTPVIPMHGRTMTIRGPPRLRR